MATRIASSGILPASVFWSALISIMNFIVASPVLEGREGAVAARAALSWVYMYVERGKPESTRTIEIFPQPEC
jgi:hypothetical protein